MAQPIQELYRLTAMQVLHGHQPMNQANRLEPQIDLKK